MEALPVELLGDIALLLDTDAFKQLRLVSRIFAIITRPWLSLDAFHGVPWRNDPRRLAGLSTIPECARRIRSVTFNLSQLDEYTAFHESYSYYGFFEPEARQERLREAWADYFTTRGLPEADGPLKLADIGEATQRLPSLKSVSFTWMKCPWEGVEPRRVFDPSNSVKKAAASILEVQKTVLPALFKLDVPLENFSMEPFMLHDLPQSSLQEWTSSNSFEFLSTLSLAPRQTNEDGALDKLDLLLSHLPGLKELRLDFEPGEQTIGMPLTASFPKLQVFHFSGAVVGMSGLAHFLTRHADTLEELDLIELMGLSPAQGSSGTMFNWDDIFFLVRDSFKHLKKARVEGTFGLYDDVVMSSPYDAEPMRFAQFMVPEKTIGSFLVGRGPYPVDAWDMMLP